MQKIIDTNIYEPEGKILIVGSCLPFMQPDGYQSLINDYDMVFSVCLEEIHINMVVTKICGMLSVGKIKSITFASVDKSPHCVQLHYIRGEIERIMSKDKIVPIFNYVVANNELHLINHEAISLSKNLLEISLLANNK